MHTPEHTPLDSVETLVRKGNTAFRVELSDILNTPLFHIQKTPVTLISFIGALLFFLGTYLFSQVLQRALRRRVFPRFKLEEGLQYTFLRLTHYFFIFIGLILGLQFIGLDLSSLAVIAGLLSVGIGFGLQNIASNFVAGIILLFERPIKVGDRISVGETTGDVHEIKIRSTTILTPDNIVIIVPNSDFISARVINWSYKDPRVRFHLPVGVAYRSDVNQVKQLLLQAARSHPQVLQNPEPDVALTAFGDSALQFDLFFWVGEPKGGPGVLSDLRFEILRLFNESGIEMPFPQREVHLKSSALPADGGVRPKVV
ncbi:MAG TPA: mechanosensitive ion channel domain-containing protein [Candidatus Manganitrophaceae bacterium]|nr:mechanosensitive ion channel domain-containing protein [Candidatus Manganitrophaceae bacterium]